MEWLNGQKLIRAGFIILFMYLVIRTAVIIPIIGGALLLAFCAQPLAEQLHKIKINGRGQLNRSIAVLTAFLLLACLFITLVSIIIYPVLAEIRQLYGQVPYYIEILRAVTAVVNEELVQPLIQTGFLAEQLESCLLIVQQTLAGGMSILMRLFRGIVGFSMQAAGRLIDFVAVPILAFYFLRDWAIIRNGFIMCFSERRQNMVRQLLADIAEIIKSFLYGQLLLCALVGSAMFLVMLLLGIDYPLLLGINAALFEAVPVIGPLLGAVPAVFLAAMVSPMLALKVAGSCLLLQLLENNFLSPRIMGNSLHIHPAAVMISLLAGGQLLGIMGMIISLPAVAILKLMLKYFWNIEGEN